MPAGSTRWPRASCCALWVRPITGAKHILDMSKEYTLDILFGFSTDTYDVLGKITESGEPLGVTRKEVEVALNEFRGMLSQEYPPYSSKTVEGKSLFQWARDGVMDNLILPRRTVTIYDINLTQLYKVKESQLLAYIQSGVEKVNGDFRQEEVLRLWKRQLKGAAHASFPAPALPYRAPRAPMRAR